MNAKKRTSLAAVFGADEVPVQRPASPETTEDISKREGPGSDDRETGGQRRATHPKRPAVKQHTAYLPLAIHDQLRKLAFEENRKMHTYLLEGLDRVFENRGLPAIREITLRKRE